MNKPMYEVYGQTECAGLATANLPGETRIGSVGKANAEVEVTLSEEAEILIRSAGRHTRLLEQAGEDRGDLPPRLAAHRRCGAHRR